MSALAIGRTLMPLVIVTLTLGLAMTFLRHGFPHAWEQWLRRVVRATVVLAITGFVAWEVLRLVRPHSPEAGLASAFQAGAAGTAHRRPPRPRPRPR